MPPSHDTGLAALNAASAAEAEEWLLACCASRAWAQRMAAGRPYADVDALTRAGETQVRALDRAELGEALAAHPRIGERAPGGGTGAGWSRREQSVAAGAGEDVQAALREANRAYEERFGRVFLVFATGRSAEEILAEAYRRLGEDPETEWGTVVDELVRITRLRLERLTGSEARR